MKFSRSKAHLLGIYLRGIAMGAADVVPGVSGGTVAFITGIYEELIDSIKSINLGAVKTLVNEGPQAFWRMINGNFLLVLMLGIVTSIASLAKLISYTLEHHPLMVWSLFFGLIAASSLHMLKQIKSWHAGIAITLLVGILLAYVVAEVKPSELPADLSLVFMSGCIAICAMILPGISGSFILVLMGMYGHILTAVHQLQWSILLSFIAGCAVGITSFSHLLSWLLHRFHDWTLSLLTGFLVGSLYLVWPWKHTLSYYYNSKGKALALEQQNVLPADYYQLTQVDPNTLWCLFFILSGFVLVLGLEKVSVGQDQSK